MQVVIHKHESVYLQALVFLAVNKAIFKDLEPAPCLSNILYQFFTVKVTK